MEVQTAGRSASCFESYSTRLNSTVSAFLEASRPSARCIAKPIDDTRASSIKNTVVSDAAVDCSVNPNTFIADPTSIRIVLAHGLQHHNGLMLCCCRSAGAAGNWEVQLGAIIAMLC